MRIYLHREATQEAEAVETAPSSIIAKALAIEGGVLLLENKDPEIDTTKSFKDAGLGDRAHVFHGQRPKVTAEVRYNGPKITREFSAAAQVDQVFRWATGKQGFDLAKADAAEHMLQLPDGSVPHADVHLGSLDEATPRYVAFDLVPKHRFEG